MSSKADQIIAANRQVRSNVPTRQLRAYLETVFPGQRQVVDMYATPAAFNDLLGRVSVPWVVAVVVMSNGWGKDRRTYSAGEIAAGMNRDLNSVQAVHLHESGNSLAAKLIRTHEFKVSGLDQLDLDLMTLGMLYRHGKTLDGLLVDPESTHGLAGIGTGKRYNQIVAAIAAYRKK